MADLFLPDLSLRQSSATLLIPLFLNFYVMAVLAILPNTFLFKLLLQPVLVWQTWRCIADVDLSAWLEHLLGVKSHNFWNAPFAVRRLFIIMLL